MKPRVLVVDDDVAFARLIEFNLAREGCEGLSAHSGVHALRVARAELPDLIFMDLMLPDLDGLAVCEILNSQPSTREIPVFILSALDQTWAESRKTKACYARFFTKPVDLKVLFESIRATAHEHLAQVRSRVAIGDAHNDLANGAIG